MNSTTRNSLATFESAFQLLIRTAKGTVNKINTNPRSLAKFCQILLNAKDNKNTIHMIGSGRSGNIAKIIGESFKDIGFTVSFFGKEIDNPIKKNDVAMAISGSGWTRYTTSAIEHCLRKNAKILTFTGSMDSKAARMSDAVIQIPLGYRSLDEGLLFTESIVPLNPLGTIFELTTLVIGMGIVNGVYSGSCANGFNNGTSNMLVSAEESFKKLTNNSELNLFIKLIKNYCNNYQSKVYFLGKGINHSISDFCSSRFKGLDITVGSISDWRFRKTNDLLIMISGSGSSSILMNQVKIAKKSNLKIVYITSFPESEIISESDIKLHILGRNENTNPDELKLVEPGIYLPIFEYTTALILESCITQIALDLGLTNEEF